MVGSFSSKGITLIETMVALLILAIASVGAFTTLLSAKGELREGQLRQYKMTLIDTKVQRLWLSSKSVLPSPALLPPSTIGLATAPLNSSGWAVDGTTPIAGDLGTGAYFKIISDGTITPLDSGTVPPVPAGTACNSGALPVGVYCREVLVTQGLLPNGALPAGATKVWIYWIRVIRSGEPVDKAALDQVVLVQ